MKWWVAGATAFAVVVSGTVVVSLGLQRGTDDRAGGADCSVPSAETVDTAAALADACGFDVEVADARTPWERTWATADGAARTDFSVMPNQVQRDGEWVELDRTLVVAEGGEAIEVAAPAYELSLSAGDEPAVEPRPLGVIEYGGERLEVWFPLELPEPSLDGPKATYRLDEGVRLEVTVSPDATGFTPIVVLDSPAAAARFEAALVAARAASGDAGTGMDVAFRTAVSDGLRVVATDGGGVEVVDEGDEVRFSSPPSVMWDAAGDDVGTASERAAGGALDAIEASTRVAPWAGASVSRLSTEGETMYRVWGGGAGKAGSWITPIKPSNAIAARQGLALPLENAATFVSEVTLPAGVRMQVGQAGSAFGQPGGWPQAQLLERIPMSSFGPAEVLK